MPVIREEEDYEPPAPQLCAGCGAQITDRYYLLAVDRQWHVRCLTCCECKLRLDSELTCFARDGNIYCKDDYYRLFAVKRCARCQRGIFASELVMRARDLVYHLHCFTCAWCNTALAQGDHFGLRDNLVYCRAHYELVLHGESYGSPSPDHNRGPGLAMLPHEAQSPSSLYGPFPTAARKGRPRKRKVSEGVIGEGLLSQTLGIPIVDSAGGCSLHLSSLDPGSVAPSSMNPSATQRTKRMRTSFKHHQLRTMKSYFNINQNPDAKDLKQLAQKTGLSKRVLQVWFQNARAKWRRNNLKQSDHPASSQNVQNQSQQSQQSQSQHVNSPGATSSFSEPSPVASCGGLSTEPHASSLPLPQQSNVLSTIDYDGNHSLTSLGPRRVPPGSDGLPLTSFQELF